MSQPTETSAFGPAIFVGLIVFTLATGEPVPPPENPAERMDMKAAAATETLIDTNGDAAPASDQPALPLARRVAHLPRPSAPVRPAAERLARALPAPPRPALGNPAWQPEVPALMRASIRPASVATPLVSPPPIPGSAPSGLPATHRNARPDTPPPGQRPRPDPATQALAHPALSDDTPQLPRLARLPTAPQPGPLARPMAPPEPVTHPALQTVTLQGTNVHLRRAPNARSPVLTQLDTGTTALAFESRGNWTRVYFPDMSPPLTGWMYSRYLAARP